MANPIPEALSHLIALNVEFQVLVCLSEECRCAVSPGAIVRHFYLKHKTPIELRKLLEQYIQGFPGSYDYSTIQLPRDRSSPQPILEVVDGSQCKECQFKTQDRSNIRKHGNKEHKKKRIRDEELFSPVRLQSWFKNGKQRYWVVDENSHEFSNISGNDLIPGGAQPNSTQTQEESTTPTQEPDAQEGPSNSYAQLESEIQQWKEGAKERRLTLLNRPPVVELDPWIRFTKWYEVIERSKHNLIRTYEFLRVPDPEEEGLQRVVRAWKRVKERCLDTLEATDHKDVLKWWVAPQKDKASQRPFELPQNSQSLDKYNLIWEQFICYLVRTVPEEQGGESETGVKLTQEQWESLKRIQGHLTVPENSNAQEPRSEFIRGSYSQQPHVIGDVDFARPAGEINPLDRSESSDSEDGSSQGSIEGGVESSVVDLHEAPRDQTPEGERDPELTNEVMNLCRLVLMQDTSRIPLYDSPLMHYLAVRGIDVQAEGFRASFFYTPILAGVLWISRLIMLEVAVPMEAWPQLGLESKATIPSIPRRVRTIRENHLIEGSFSPVSSILTQLAMGKKNNQTHQSPSNIHWSQDSQTIFYGGMPIELAKIRTMGQKITTELRETLKELAFGLELPKFDLGQLVDSMAWSSEFRRTDYSFINHSKNPEELRVGHEFLFREAQKPKGPWNLFNTKSYEATWKKGGKHQYLVKEKQFLRKLMVAFQIEWGQPGRGPEVGSLKTSNSIYSARNIYVINGRVGLVTTYDKAQKRRGNTEYIVRFLPDEDSQLVVQYLVFVRPFARALDQRESEWLFGDLQGPWAGEQLSRELAKATSKHLSARLTVSGWRHVAIGIAVRHLTKASKTWELEGEGEEEEEEEFAEGDDEEELEENIQSHIIVR